MKRKLAQSRTDDTQITAHIRDHSTANKGHATPSTNGTSLPDIHGRGPIRAWLRFWFTPVTPAGLNGLRVLSGLLFAFWLLAFAGHQAELFGLNGWFDLQAYKEAARLPADAPAPPFGWSILYLCGTNDTLLNVVYWSSIAVLLLFTAGVATRITSVLTWIIIVSFTANPALRFDADFLLVVLALYLMIGHLLLGQWSWPLSLAERVLGPTPAGVFASFGRVAQRDEAPRPSYAANLAVRLLQVHFAVIVVGAGLHKLQVSDWWTGVAFWYPLHPPMETTFDRVKTNFALGQSILVFMSLAVYATLAWQLCFPFFAWRRGWGRWLLLGGAAVGWVGSILIWRLPLFGPFFAIASLAYLTPGEWDRLTGRVANGFNAVAGRLHLPVGRTAAKSSHVEA